MPTKKDTQIKYDKAVELRKQGYSDRRIATELHISRNTIRKMDRASVKPVEDTSDANKLKKGVKNKSEVVKQKTSKQDLEQQQYKKFLEAADLIAHKGYSINKATTEVGMSKNTFRKRNAERGNLVSPVYGKKNKQGKGIITGYEVDEKYAYVKQMPAIVYDPNGEPTTVKADFDKYYASIIGSYWTEIGDIERGEIPDFPSIPDIIYDLDAKVYRLVKDYDTLSLFLQMQTDEYMSEIWTQFQSEKRTSS